MINGKRLGLAAVCGLAAMFGWGSVTSAATMSETYEVFVFENSLTGLPEGEVECGSTILTAFEDTLTHTGVFKFLHDNPGNEGDNPRIDKVFFEIGLGDKITTPVYIDLTDRRGLTSSGVDISGSDTPNPQGDNGTNTARVATHVAVLSAGNEPMGSVTAMTAVPVPVPVAAWMGLSTFGILGGIAAHRKRRYAA